jgi:hypothetical protein
MTTAPELLVSSDQWLVESDAVASVYGWFDVTFTS